MVQGRRVNDLRGTKIEDDERSSGPVVDLERLEQQAESLYLTRFVEAVRKARGEYGRYLRLRPGDELAIRAAGDGSEEYLDAVTVEYRLG